MLKSLFMGALALGLTIPTVSANTIILAPTGFDGGQHGGEFLATTDNLGKFVTFCLEKNEGIHYGITYNTTLNTAAVLGGPNHALTPNFDTISAGTAWLYEQFRAGTLTPPPYLGSHNVNAGLLQNAIWALEDEVSFASQAANPYLLLAIANNGGTFASAQADANFANTLVRVLNIWGPGNPPDGNPSRYRQDVLVIIPGVPDGGTTLMLLGSALTGLALIRRKLS